MKPFPSRTDIQKLLRDRRMRLFFRGIFVILWLMTLKDTDSLYINYLILAFISLSLALFPTDERAPKRHIALLACAFSLMVWGANYTCFFGPYDTCTMRQTTALAIGIKDSITCLIGGFAVAYPILQLSYTKCQSLRTARLPADPEKKNRFFFLKIFGLLLPIYLINLFFVEYPGSLSPDPMAQIGEMVSGEYTRFNSYYHTLLFQSFLKIGYSLFADPNAAIATFCTFQVLLLCASFAWCLSTMRLSGVPVWYLIAAFLGYALLPHHLALSVTVWKDTMFGIGCLLMCTALYRCLREVGKKSLNYCVFTAGCLIFCISRNIGVYACLLTFLCMLPFLRKRPILLTMMGCVTALCCILNGPILTLLDVERPDYVEFISLPLQQVCRVITEGRTLTEEETAMLSRILDLEQVNSIYDSSFSDPIKNMFRQMDMAWFEERPAEYLKLWLRIGLRYPMDYLRAWVDLTRGYWNGGYECYMYSRSIMTNDYGIHKTISGGPLYALYRLWFGIFERMTILQPLYSVGIHTWALATVTTIEVLKKRKEWILSIPALTVILGLMVGTPVFCEFRYVYPVITSFPLVLSAFLFPPASRDTAKI